MNGKSALIISITIVIAALGYLVYAGLSDNMVYYYHVEEFYPKAASLDGETVKVNGKVVNGSIQKNVMDYAFVIHGEKGSRIPVDYHGVAPDTFKDSSDVVVEGSYDSQAGVFHATTLMAKCPTKYEPKNQAQMK
jgi:cytochrome c-type biogenesis protein CcmE